MATASADVIRIVRARLRNQRLAGRTLATAADVVSWFGAVQAQDVTGARWAVGQRTTSATDAQVSHALDEGRILRTHVLRPTWHFVAPADIRWMLALTGPKIMRAAAAYYRANGVDDAMMRKARRVVTRALRDGADLTRAEIRGTLLRNGMAVEGPALGNLMMQFELEALVCSGPRRGGHSTYALLDERVPAAGPPDRDEALAELARRYFQSHGPATVHDFGWWSGLTLGEARTAVAALHPALVVERIGSVDYCHIPFPSPPPRPTAAAHLLPNYDEFLVAYRDRSAAIEIPPAGAASRSDIFAHVLTINGRVAGTWTRTARTSAATGATTIAIQVRRALTAPERRLVEEAAARYGRFVGQVVGVVVT